MKEGIHALKSSVLPYTKAELVTKIRNIKVLNQLLLKNELNHKNLEILSNNIE